jgi:phenylpropionate dioxygenase-like ring-hydroxylating dioxygenase large terminal subunit
MLSKEQNEYVTRTGAGTPMGTLFRSYWIPALLPEELPESDCPPVRCELLGEKLIAFRDTQGRLGIIEEFCAHRRAFIALVWPERECGCRLSRLEIRRYGQCVDIPSEPPESEHYKKIKMRGYPLVERGGILGPTWVQRTANRRFPEWEFAMVPASHRFVSSRRRVQLAAAR